MKARYYILIAITMFATISSAQTRKVAKNAATATKTAKTANATNTMSQRAKALFDDMLPNTQRVFVIDSTIVDKNNVIEAIPLPKAYGKFVAYDEFFGKRTGSDSYVFVNGFGNRCYYTELGTDSISRLYMCDKLGDKWANPIAIREINERFTDISYPYMSSDGQTLFFAGVSGEDGLGQRDIYMAKYDADEGHFMQPENIGLPFNSPADDYAYIVADADGIAWFATTRRQPAGKACVYAFVPTETRQNYSADEIPHNRLVSLANLTRIRETWPTPEIRDMAMARLKRLRSKADASASGTGDINFAIDDNTTYTNISQFRSDETRKAYYDIIRQRNELNSVAAKTDNLRTQYHNADATKRHSLGPQIARLEQNAASLRDGIKKSEQELRRKERRLIKGK